MGQRPYTSKSWVRAQATFTTEACWLQDATPVLEEWRVSPGRAVTPPHDTVRKRASHTGANKWSYKLFILQNRGIFYGVEHWNHSIMNGGVETL